MLKVITTSVGHRTKKTTNSKYVSFDIINDVTVADTYSAFL